jgi:hypothetical protein
LNIEIQSVDNHSNLEGITLDADYEQINELLVWNLIFFCGYKWLIVVFFAIHLENNVDIISCHQELLSVVLGYSLFNGTIIDHDFFIVSLVVLSVSGSFDRKVLFVEHLQVKFGGVLVES